MRRTSVLTATCLLLAACGGDADTDESTAGDTVMMGAPGDTVPAPAGAGGGSTAVIRDASGREIGTVTLTDAGGGVAISGTLSGLPAGTHGIHIHATGRCEPPFESAGDHWNPTRRQHGLENPQGPHFGDMPNLTVGEDGRATVQATTPGGSLRGADALLDADGAAVVVHAQPDDQRTDPAGGAGDRIACGVVPGG